MACCMSHIACGGVLTIYANLTAVAVGYVECFSVC